MKPIKAKFKPLRDNVFVSNMDFGERKTQSGIVLRSDDGKSEGIRPRWGRVWAIGPEQFDVKIGEWVLVEHGRWTRGISVVDDDNQEITVRQVEVKSILVVSDELPSDVQLGEYDNGSNRTHEFDFSKPMF